MFLKSIPQRFKTYVFTKDTGSKIFLVAGSGSMAKQIIILTIGKFKEGFWGERIEDKLYPV